MWYHHTVDRVKICVEVRVDLSPNESSNLQNGTHLWRKCKGAGLSNPIDRVWSIPGPEGCGGKQYRIWRHISSCFCMLDVLKKDKARFDAQQGADPQGRCVGGWAGLCLLWSYTALLFWTALPHSALLYMQCPAVGWAIGTPGQNLLLTFEIWHQGKQFKSSSASYRLAFKWQDLLLSRQLMTNDEGSQVDLKSWTSFGHFRKYTSCFWNLNIALLAESLKQHQWWQSAFQTSAKTPR